YPVMHWDVIVVGSAAIDCSWQAQQSTHGAKCRVSRSKPWLLRANSAEPLSTSANLTSREAGPESSSL
ncbi:MAG: hypothetical protein AB8E74_04915, partial [Prochlorococcus sp.]